MKFFSRKKEEPMSIAKVVSSLENTVIYLKRMQPTMSEKMKNEVIEKYGVPIDQLLSQIEHIIETSKSLIENFPNVEHLMSKKERNELSKEMRSMNKTILSIIREYENGKDRIN